MVIRFYDELEASDQVEEANAAVRDEIASQRAADRHLVADVHDVYIAVSWWCGRCASPQRSGSQEEGCPDCGYRWECVR